jgi:hypothetical protein
MARTTREKLSGKTRLTAADPFVVIDELRAAFKDVPPEEIEREVARSIAEERARRRRATPRPVPRGV